MILELNTENQEKEMLEGQRRYREMMASAYKAGYTDAKEENAKSMAEKDAAIAEMDAEIAAKDAAIAEMDTEISELKQKTAALKAMINNND